MTDDSSISRFLRSLLDAPGPSGFEVRPARVVREEAGSIAGVGGVDTDVHGNVRAEVAGREGPTVMLAGHIDEIGLMLTHIDEKGFLYIDGIGGWDPQVLVGQRVRILSRDGDQIGAVGRRPIHLIRPDDREKAVKMTDLWVDVGARNHEEVQERGIRVGDPAVIDARLVELGRGLIASRSIDNRIGAYVVLEALRELAGSERPAAGRTVAVATTQEEIGHHGGGARSSAFSIEPQVALVVDVTFATDAPEVEKKEIGEHRLGGGPVLGRGSAIHPLVFERLASVAEAEGIPYTIQANARYSSTDADAIYLSRQGVATGLISIPNRYMHSPNEIVHLGDLAAAAKLIAAFVRSLEGDADFRQR